MSSPYWVSCIPSSMLAVETDTFQPKRMESSVSVNQNLDCEVKKDERREMREMFREASDMLSCEVSLNDAR